MEKREGKITPRSIRRVLLVLAGLVFISGLISFIFTGVEIFKSIKVFFDQTFYGILMGFVFFLGNSVIGYITAQKMDWINHTERANLISLLSFMLFGIAASILVPYFFHSIVNGMSGEDLRRTVVMSSFINLTVDILVISVYYSHYMVKHLKASIENEKNLKREKLLAKYEALKNQVNPHFLFNSLNTLAGVVEQDSEKAVEYIEKLSKIYRYVLDQRDKELTTVEKELSFVNDYVYLAKLRYGCGLQVNIAVESMDKMVVPLGLQILIENCIKHNVVEDDRPLTIKLYEQRKYLVVENNMQKKTTIAKKEKIGLDNLTKRYQYLCDAPVVIENSELSFIVKVPLLNKS